MTRGATPRRVHVADVRWRGAVEELVPRVVPADTPGGTVHVLDGQGSWWCQVQRVVAAGAPGVVVVRPSPAPVDRVEALSALAVPVALCRPWLRGRSPAVPERAVHLVVADVVTARDGAATALRDAAGWARHLAGAPLVVQAVARSDAAVVVTATSAAGTPVTLTLVLGSAGTSTLLDVVAVGPTRAEVHVDDATGRSWVAVTDDRGTLVRPREHEDDVRAALRRVVEALDAGPSAAPLPDLVDLAADEAVVGEALVAAP